MPVNVISLFVRSWWRDRRAATAIEYGLIAGVISLALVTAIFLMGGSLNEIFSALASSMADSAERVSE